MISKLTMEIGCSASFKTSLQERNLKVFGGLASCLGLMESAWRHAKRKPSLLRMVPSARRNQRLASLALKIAMATAPIHKLCAIAMGRWVLKPGIARRRSVQSSHHLLLGALRMERPIFPETILSVLLLPQFPMVRPLAWQRSSARAAATDPRNGMYSSQSYGQLYLSS